MEEFLQMGQGQHHSKVETQNTRIAWSMTKNKDKYYVTRGRLEGKIERLKRQHELLAYRGQFPQACNQC